MGTIYIYKTEHGIKLRVDLDYPVCHGSDMKYQYLESEGDNLVEALENLAAEAETFL